MSVVDGLLYQCFFYTVVFRFVNCVTFSDEFEVCSFFFHEKKVKRLFRRLYVLKFQIATKIRFALQNSLFIIFLSTSVIKIYLLKIGIYFKVFIKLVIQTSQTRHCENMMKIKSCLHQSLCFYTEPLGPPGCCPDNCCKQQQQENKQSSIQINPRN